jgi:hypothetical protein
LPAKSCFRQCRRNDASAHRRVACAAGGRLSCTACRPGTPLRPMRLERERVMAKPDILIVDGRAFSWQRLCELRRQQLEARQAAQPRQLVLFDPKDDCRPATERTAAGRYPSRPCWTARAATGKQFRRCAASPAAASIGSLSDATFTPSRKSRKPPNSAEAVARERRRPCEFVRRQRR